MCTVIVGFKLFQRKPLVIAANRDELLDRPTAPPAIRDLHGSPVLTVHDLQRGGSPIGVNARGVFAAVTNRFDVTSVGGQTSRGDLVHRALMMDDAASAARWAAHLDARRYNGFHLIIGDAEGLWIFAGDGKDGPELPREHRVSGPGLAVVSNLGIGPAHAPRAEQVMRVWQSRRLERSPPHRATWDALLTLHDPHPNDEAAWMKRMASTCIHRPIDDNYGTKSSAFIMLDAAWGPYPAEWRWWHRERPSAEAHNCTGRWEPELRQRIDPAE